jgi:hypothetical protein
MDNIQIVSTERDGVINENVIITHDDGSTTVWIKSAYDAQIAATNTLPSNSSIPQAGE